MLFTVHERVISYCNHETSWIHFSVSVSFFEIPCNKGHLIRAYLSSWILISRFNHRYFRNIVSSYFFPLKKFICDFIYILYSLCYGWFIWKWSPSKTRSGQTPLSIYYVYWTALFVKIPTFVSELIKTECVVHITKFEELLFLPIPFLTY